MANGDGSVRAEHTELGLQSSAGFDITSGGDEVLCRNGPPRPDGLSGDARIHPEELAHVPSVVCVEGIEHHRHLTRTCGRVRSWVE
jgi:hypothetical protein